MGWDGGLDWGVRRCGERERERWEFRDLLPVFNSGLAWLNDFKAHKESNGRRKERKWGQGEE
jgi:hypothetical protein